MEEKHKAHTIAKGFTQVIGEDYEETYTSVVWLKSVCSVCAVVAVQNLCLWKIDFVSTFLNSESTFDVYIEQPKGFEEERERFVWKLNKTLYGIMQGAHNWAKTWTELLKAMGTINPRLTPKSI